MESIKAYDDMLAVRFNQRSGLFEVWRYGGGVTGGEINDRRDHFVLNVVNPDATFRPLDRRVLADIAARDIKTYGGARQAREAILAHERRVTAERERLHREAMGAAHDEFYHAIRKDIGAGRAMTSVPRE